MGARIVGLAVVLALAFAAVSGWISARSSAAELDQRKAAIARLAAAVDSLSARADSLETLALERADTVEVEVDRYRTVAARLRRQLDSLQTQSSAPAAPVRLDPADLRVVLDQGDTLAEACTLLARDCGRALAAKDSALATQAQLNRQLEDYTAQLAERLRGAEREKWLFGIGGSALTLAVCWAAN